MNGKWLDDTAAPRTWSMTSSAARRRASCRSRGRQTPASARGITTEDIFKHHHYKSAAVSHSDAGGHRQQKRQPHVERAAPARRPAGRDEIKIVSEIGDMAENQRRSDLRDAPVENLRRRPIDCNRLIRASSTARATFQNKPFTSEDIRFTQSKNGKTLYAIVLEIPPDGKVTVKSLAANSEYWPDKIGSVRLVGGGKLKFTRDENGLHVTLPEKFDKQNRLRAEDSILNFLMTAKRLMFNALNSSISFAGGQLAFSVSGQSRSGYAIEISTNLTQWSSVFTTNSPAMPFVWTDTATNGRQRFYHVKPGRAAAPGRRHR